MGGPQITWGVSLFTTPVTNTEANLTAAVAGVAGVLGGGQTFPVNEARTFGITVEGLGEFGGGASFKQGGWDVAVGARWALNRFGIAANVGAAGRHRRTDWANDDQYGLRTTVAFDIALAAAWSAEMAVDVFTPLSLDAFDTAQVQPRVRLMLRYDVGAASANVTGANGKKITEEPAFVQDDLRALRHFLTAATKPLGAWFNEQKGKLSAAETVLPTPVMQDLQMLEMLLRWLQSGTWNDTAVEALPWLVPEELAAWQEKIDHILLDGNAASRQAAVGLESTLMTLRANLAIGLYQRLGLRQIEGAGGVTCPFLQQVHAKTKELLGRLTSLIELSQFDPALSAEVDRFDAMVTRFQAVLDGLAPLLTDAEAKNMIQAARRMTGCYLTGTDCPKFPDVQESVSIPTWKRSLESLRKMNGKGH